MIKISPSLLAADMLRLGEQVNEAAQGGADRLHLDVMDGCFVPNISFGLPVLQALRPVSRLPLEAHLMIVKPERFLEPFAQGGADTIIVHQEESPHLNRTLQIIKQLGKRAGVALNPSTPAILLEEVIEDLDLILIMTVNPGFGGQEFLGHTLRKIRQVRQMLDDNNPQCDLEVDGGIEADTAPQVVRAGASVLVAGTAVFRYPEGVPAGIQNLRAVAKA